MMRTANPALNSNVFSHIDSGRGQMTIQGTVNRTAVLLALAILSASFTWRMAMGETQEAAAIAVPWILGGAIGGFIAAMVTVFKRNWAPISAPIYALLEGLFLGGISALFEKQYNGIVSQAILLTLGVLACLLVAYKSGLIRPTENFKLGVVAATGGVCFFYVISMILGFFGVSVPLIHSNGLFGIGFSVVVVIIASLNLVLDFDFIESGAEAGAPKYMEWYGAFGLMVTLVWLYIEILRLLAKLNSRR